MQFRLFSLITAALLMSGSAVAGDYKLGDIRIDHAYARATVPGQPAGAAYLTIENQGKAADKLMSASSPVAKTAEIHTMTMEGNVMRMREVGTIELKPSEKISMAPGHGYHIMLMGLKKPLAAGDKIPLSLVFEKSGKVDISLVVEDRNAKNSAAHHGAQSHHHQ